MRRGESLEKLVGLIETAISGQDDIEVAWNQNLTDRITGQNRQFDVLVRTPSGPRILLTGIECRDKSRKVTVNEVEAYVTKCLDTGIDRAAMVSTAGFTKTARQKALAHGVECIDLKESKPVDWLQGPLFPLFRPRVKHTDWYFEPEHGLKGDSAEFRVIDTNGNEVTVKTLKPTVERVIKHLFKNPKNIQAGKKVFRFNPKGLFVIDKHGNKVPASLAQATIDFVVDETKIPLNFKKRKEQDSDFPTIEIAEGVFELGDIEGRVTMVNQPGEGTKLFFQLNQKKVALRKNNICLFP